MPMVPPSALGGNIFIIVSSSSNIHMWHPEGGSEFRFFQPPAGKAANQVECVDQQGIIKLSQATV